MSKHGRWIHYSWLILCTLALTAGCAPARTEVPWWRGIPSNFMAKNSLEAEDWRIQHRGSPPAEPEIYRYAVHAPLVAGATSTPSGVPSPAVKEAAER